MILTPELHWKRNMNTKILLAACGTVFVLLSSELLIRLFDVDLCLLQKELFYQDAFPSLHKTSLDAQRLHELKAKESLEGIPVHPKETKYKQNNREKISINALGFRGKEYFAEKGPGVFRIVTFGGSNIFGYAVSDEDTYPAQMQKVFDKRYPGKIEVWNAGICAYEMSQNVAYARDVIKKFNPDLLIFHETNIGRRAFFRNTTFEELKGLFRKNNELFIENMPPPWRHDIMPATKTRRFFASVRNKIHRWLIFRSATYRVFCASLYSWSGFFRAITTGPHQGFWGHDGLLISDRDFNLFTKEHEGKQMVWFCLSKHVSPHIAAIQKRKNLAFFVLNTKNKPAEYEEMHPPSHVYAWYARELCDFLMQNGYVPVNRTVSEEAGSLQRNAARSLERGI